MDYLSFLQSKQHSTIDFGFEPSFMPERAFDFQRAIITKAVRKGRIAIFADTGLGKTLMQLSIAQNIIQQFNKRVLILTPLAVAFQFILEAKELGIDDIEYSKDGKFTKKIVICNYERLHYFNENDFEAVILDESSILKNFEGIIKNKITTFIKKIPYRFLSTATPSPNDYIELGTSSEVLGYLGYTDMLSRFFKNNQNNTIKSSQAAMANAGVEWYIKPHAEDDFWRWVSTWAISIRKPSDLGFSDEKYILPELNEDKHVVDNKRPLEINGQVQLFNIPATGFREIKAEVRATINERCERAVELALGHDISFLWVNLNDEGDLIERLLPNSINIQGSDSLEKKEESVLWFIGQKCICDSKHFKLNWQKREGLCGSQNTQKDAEKNIKTLLRREKEEGLNAEALKRIKSTWLDIIKIIQINSNVPTRKKKTESEESVIGLIKNIEISAKSYPLNTIERIQPSELKELLSHTEYQLTNIMRFLEGSQEDALSASQSLIQLNEGVWLLTIATLPIESGVYYAPLVISDSDILKTIPTPSPEQSCTCGHISGKRRLISKSTIFGFGLNFQHCNHTTYFPTYSYEQYYQAIRRFWRFGQKREVFVDLVLSDGQTKIMEALQIKKDKANSMFEKLSKNINSVYTMESKEFSKEIIKPKFL